MRIMEGGDVYGGADCTSHHRALRPPHTSFPCIKLIFMMHFLDPHLSTCIYH